MALRKITACRGLTAAAGTTAAAGVLLLGAAAPALAAGDVGVRPYAATPGQHVRIDSGDCAPPARATSAAFDGSAELHDHAGLLTGTTQISEHAEPGVYKVVVVCDDATTFAGSFRVRGAKVPAARGADSGTTFDGALVDGSGGALDDDLDGRIDGTEETGTGSERDRGNEDEQRKEGSSGTLFLAGAVAIGTYLLVRRFRSGS
ncbi:hypothetical protein [Rhizohabitans arisaemae]|uniref:hypothetical protein n=1 Tax=Rhizohabitans arisaemae TaxID=2720610 RepID=UPI0024B066D9|nr:hypothetical protein [Rhizohabitans arisaemae]